MKEIYLVTVGGLECMEIIAAFELETIAQAVVDAINEVPCDPTMSLSTGADLHVVPFNPSLADILDHVRTLVGYMP